MNQFNNSLVNLINKSKITTIGYSIKDELIKDELISNFNCIEIREISSSFSFKSFLRNQKLNHILDDIDYSKYILLDIDKIEPPYDGGPQKWDKLSFINTLLKNLKLSILDTDYKIILTSTLYESGTKNGKNIQSLSSGDYPTFVSNLVLVIEKYIAKVIKSREVFSDDYYSIYEKQIQYF